MNPYTIVDLGSITNSGHLVTPTGVNNKGIAVGYLVDIYEPSALRYDGKLDLLPSPFPNSFTSGINNSASEIIVGGAGDVTAVWIDGEYIPPPEQLTVNFSHAVDVNDDGMVVGMVAGRRPFRFNTTTREVQILPFGGQATRVFGINAAGKVIGWTQPPGDFDGAAFLFDGTAHLLPTPGPIPELARSLDINDEDFVVGNYEYSPGIIHAFLYNHQTQESIDIHPLGDVSTSFAGAINNRKEIVGVVHYGPDSQHIPVIWTPEGDAHNLRDLLVDPGDWQLEGVSTISDKGHIVGRGVHLGKNRAFLMTPVRSQSGPSVGNFAMDVKVIMSAGGGVGFRLDGSILYPKGPPIGPDGPLELAQRDALVGLAIQTLARDISDPDARRIAEHGGIEVVRRAAERGRSGDSIDGRKSSWLSRLLRKILVWLEW